MVSCGPRWGGICLTHSHLVSVVVVDGWHAEESGHPRSETLVRLPQKVPWGSCFVFPLVFHKGLQKAASWFSGVLKSRTVCRFEPLAFGLAFLVIFDVGPF